jgi:uncharacterized repeat protein (TIGR03803 family)
MLRLSKRDSAIYSSLRGVIMRWTIPVVSAVIALPIVGCQGIPQHAFPYAPASYGLALAGGERVIHSFAGSPHGELPGGNPIVDSAGGLYGTTFRGGTSGACGGGCGTIFRLAQNAHGRWKETTLWSFDLTRGAYPSYPLVADPSGNLYGATDVGGNLGVAYGLFHRTNGFQLQVLHNFQGGYDGAQPRSNLIFDRHGNLYSTTVAGGTGGSGGGGTVYELIPSGSNWTEKILYRFSPYTSGANPQAGVIFGPAGGLYGTTTYGGNNACPTGCGVVFKLAPAGKGRWTESVLHAFNGSDGCYSVAGLITDAAGNFFGSTDEGGSGGCSLRATRERSQTGCVNGCGALFELSRGARGHYSFTVVHYFTAATGAGPSGNLVLDGAGNLYGTTVIGGSVGSGVVFKLAPAAHNQWKYTVLHTFSNTPDGSQPTGVVMGTNGKLYGTTGGGGALGLGAAFEVTP